MYENLDFERLRSDLINYFGTATSTMPISFIYLMEVETCTNEQLIYIAKKNEFDLNDYKNKIKIK